MSFDQSLNDSLTGVFSRAYLYTRLNDELKRATRYSSSFSILLVDLDYFKSINDAFGHLKGDQVLAEFAEFLKEEVRNSDLVFRYGGDEFVILMPYTPKNKAVYLAERLLEKIRTIHFGEKNSLNLTMSCGIATFPGDGKTAEDLFEIADQHHYLAKRNGRDCVVCESPQPYANRPLEEVSRLIERDEGMSIARNFLNELPRISRSVMRLTGEPGLGISRFMQEVTKIARLSGIGVLTLRGSPAFENRKFSVLLDALVENSLVLIQDVDKIVFSQDWLIRVNGLISQWLDKKGYSGLLITLEDIPKIDRASLDILKACFFASQDFPLGLVYADSGIQAQQLFPFGVQADAVVHLKPISQAGVQVWLRQSLHWEPPAEFVEWIAEKSGGYPASIQKSLEDLIRMGVIKTSPNGLSLAENYREDGFLHLDQVKKPTLQGNLFTNPNTDFIGRHTEIYALKKLVLDERLLTLVGMGGMGKSRLAYQVALESQDRFTNGALYMSLAGVEDVVSITYILADALGIKLLGKISEREQIVNYLFNKEILILLDDLEQFRDGIELVTYLIENTLAVRFLVTARERLGIRHEMVYELQGLKTPGSHEIDEFETYSSIQLFLQVARRGRPDFQVRDSDWPYIVQICQQLSGVPLGIELAAAWVESLSCSEIAAQLQQNTDIIKISPSSQNLPGRKLDSIINTLWGRFSELEQVLLLGMLIFRGGFSRHAAQKILGVSLFFLDALVNKSILRHAGNDRYMLHELIHQQLSAFMDFSLLSNQSYKEKHADYYLMLAAGVQELVNQSKEKEALIGINLEIENIRVAWQWAVNKRKYRLIQPAMPGLFIFFEQRGRFKEGRDFFTNLHQQMKAESPENRPESYPCLLATVLAYLGKFDYHLGNYPQSHAFLEKALSGFLALKLHAEVAHTCYEMGNLKRAQGDYEQARELLNESLLYYQEVSDQRMQGDILNSLGVIASGLGEIDLAEQYYSACLEKFQDLADPGKISRALNNLGYSYMEKGDYQASQPYLLRSLDIAQDIGAEPLSGAILDSLATLYYAMGDYVKSTRYYRDGLRLCVKLNALPLSLEILLGYAMIYSKTGKLHQAAELMCLVYHHPSVVHEIRERAGRMLRDLEQEMHVECLSSDQIEITSLDVDHAISNILYPHQIK